jgi:hypothetical protein
MSETSTAGAAAVSVKERSKRRAKSIMPDWDRYLRIVRWAEARYTADGILVMSRGNVPSVFKRIEYLAWDRYVIGEPKKQV